MAAINLGVAIISFLNCCIFIDTIVLNEVSYPDLFPADYLGKHLY
jgi:hypothetical protein